MIKKIAFTLIVIGHLYTGWSQPSSRLTDSLLVQLDKTKPEKKVGILNQIAQSFIPDDPNKCMVYAEKALNLAVKFNNKEQEALANQNMGVAFYKLYKFDDALKYYTKALSIFKELNKQPQLITLYVRIGLVQGEKNDYNGAKASFSSSLKLSRDLNDKAGMANALNALGSLDLKEMNLNTAFDYYSQSLIIRKSLNNQSEIASSYGNVALVYRKMNQYDSAISFNQHALDIRQKLNNPGIIANTYNDIGNVYWDKQNWEKAIEYYFRSIKIRYETGNKIEIANSYQNIGLLFSNLGNIDKAREYYQLALTIYMDNDDKRKLAAILTSLGNIEKDSKNFEEALSYYNRALTYRKNIGEKRDIASSLNNLGIIYNELKQPSQSIKNFEEALKIRREIDDANGEIATLNDMGNFYETRDMAKAQTTFETAYKLADKTNNTYYIGLCGRKLAEHLLLHNQVDKALNLLDIAYNAGLKLNNAELQKRVYFIKYEYYKKAGDFKESLENYENYTQINDNQQNAQNTLKMLSINQNLELEKKNNEIKNIENEVELLRQRDELQKLALTKQKYFSVFLLILAFFAVLTGLLFYSRYKIKKKHSLMLEQQYAIIEESNNRLKKSEADLTVLNATKDRFFTIIAHDIKNPLSSLLNLSQIIVEKFDTLKDNEIQEFNKMIFESSRNLYNLLENLLNWARTNTNKMRFNPLPLKLMPVVSNIIILNKLTANHKNIVIKNNVTEDIEVYADLQMLTSILRNLISNALKFTPNGGTITINAKDKYTTIEISISDTGLGISPTDMDKLFRLDTHFTTKGTGDESGTGLGLILVKEFVEKNKGKISISSQSGVGSTFTFTLPGGK